MNIDEWEKEIEEAFKRQGKEYSAEIRKMMHSFTREETAYEDVQVSVEVTNAMNRYFWWKALRGETFGELSRIKEKFGKTLEENYGLSGGAFLDVARAYWTYKIEVLDLFPDFSDKWISQALGAVELNLAEVFFPTPGPFAIPASERREVQRQYLEKFAPDLDIDRFLNENPILEADRVK